MITVGAFEAKSRFSALLERVAVLDGSIDGQTIVLPVAG